MDRIVNAFYSLSSPEKTKDNEHMESYGDGTITFLSTNPTESVESEKHEVTDVEQLKRRSPDEVCAAQYNAVSQRSDVI